MSAFESAMNELGEQLRAAVVADGYSSEALWRNSFLSEGESADSFFLHYIRCA